MNNNHTYTGFDAVGYLSATRPLRLLDVGCSDCAEGESLIQNGIALTGIDLDEVTLRKTRSRLPLARFIGADAATFTLNSQTPFNAILIRRPDVLFQATRWQQVFKRLPDWLQKDGLVLITAPEQTEAAMVKNWLVNAGFKTVVLSQTGIADEQFLITAKEYEADKNRDADVPQPLPNVLMWSDETDGEAMVCDIKTGQCTPVNTKNNFKNKENKK